MPQFKVVLVAWQPCFVSISPSALAGPDSPSRPSKGIKMLGPPECTFPERRSIQSIDDHSLILVDHSSHSSHSCPVSSVAPFLAAAAFAADFESVPLFVAAAFESERTAGDSTADH